MVADEIVTLADLDAYQDGEPQAAIDQATAAVRGYCGWHVTPPRQEILTIDGSGTPILVLPSLHITDVTSVDVGGDALTNGTGYTWSSAGYLVRVGCSWPTGTAIKVALTHGLEEAPEVARIILATASRAQKSPDGTVRRQVGPFNETFSQSGFNQAAGGTLLDAEKAVLDRYRLPWLA